MEELFNKFLESKGLSKEFKEFVEESKSTMKNLKYELSVMSDDADFWIDMSFVISKDDKAFLKEWAKTLKETRTIFCTGYEDSEKDWNGEMVKRLFDDEDVRYLLKDCCTGTSYKITPTDTNPGDIEDNIYYHLKEEIMGDISEELTELYKKTSFYRG